MVAHRQVQELSNSDYVRFWSKANLTADISKCWFWQRGLDITGYGSFTVNKKSEKAHRVAFLSYYNHQPGDQCVCHKCDNPSCINPTHLFLGTRGDNNRDCVNKGRKFILNGELSGTSKLTEVQVYEILDLIGRKGAKIKDVKLLYGVTSSLISQILSGKRWGYIDRSEYNIKQQKRLSKEDVIEIRMLKEKGEKNKDIAKLFSIRPDSVLKIVSRKNWTNV